MNKPHEQVEMYYEPKDKTVLIDKELQPLIKYLWHKGIKTSQCCQGGDIVEEHNIHANGFEFTYDEDDNIRDFAYLMFKDEYLEKVKEIMPENTRYYLPDYSYKDLPIKEWPKHTFGTHLSAGKSVWASWHPADNNNFSKLKNFKMRIEIEQDDYKKILSRQYKFDINKDKLWKAIIAELETQERVDRESKCKECKGSGKITTMRSKMNSIDNGQANGFDRGGYGMRYCDCEAGSRVKMQEVMIN